MIQMPEFYHCHLVVEGEKGPGHYLNDLSINMLFTDILLPFSSGKQFIFDGYMIAPSKVRRLKVVKTPSPAKVYIEEHYEEMRRSNVADLATIPKSIAITNGEDITTEILKKAKDESALNSSVSDEPDRQDGQTLNRKIFVVHGHDMASMHELCRILKDEFTLEPVVLSEQPSVGLDTIISKFERLADTCTAVAVLLTPDDKMSESETLRARQNVIFELGYFLGKLRTAEQRGIMIFSKGNVEVPSDINGVVYLPYDKSITEVFYQMKKQIEIWGY
jgi:predicted nucleotide-binding protein